MIKLSKKLKLPADLFSRNTLYGLITQAILDQREPQENSHSLEILDVGGYEGKISWFMPQHTKITVFDAKPPHQAHNTNYVQGDARKLPFPDQSFDLVISSDMLEHIAPADREQVISEMLRVSRRHLILAAPFNSVYNQKAEEFINQQFVEYSGSNHPFLIEHLQNGLPELDEVEDYLNLHTASYLKIGEGNIYNWYLQQLTAGAKINYQGPRAFNEFFNENLFNLGNFRAPTYRTVILADKTKQLDRRTLQEIIEEHNNFHTTTYFEAYKKAFDELRAILTEKESQISHTNEQFSDYNQKLQESFSQNIEKDHHIKLLSSQINEVQTVIHEKNQEIVAREQEVFNIQKKYTQFQLEMQSQLSELGKKNALLDTQIRSQDLLLSRLNQALESTQRSEQELTNLIVLKEQNLAEKNQEINARNLQVAQLQTSLSEYKHELETVLQSRSWKLVKIYGKLKYVLYTRPKYLLNLSLQVISKMGWKEFFKRTSRKLLRLFKSNSTSEPIQTDYQKFVEETTLSAKDHKRIREEIASFDYKPLVSIVMPVWNVDEIWLRKAINSVLAQLYEKWELCIADDASTRPSVKAVLQEFQALDPRIKVTYRSQNGGIVKATNTALKMAQGGYIAFMDNDDEIAPNALYEVVKVIQQKRYDLIYSDEDKLDLQGFRCEPAFKPDFNPDLLFSCNYICHFSVYRRKIVDEIGGLREGFDGSQDYDFVLRFTEKNRLVCHIPKVLYHWRKIPGSTATDIAAKPYAYEAGKKALRDTLKRRGIKGEVFDGVWTGSFRVKREISGEPLVSIIIPFRDKVDILKICIDSIFAKTTYQNYEIILVNNSSELLETRQYMREIENCPRVHLLHYNAPYNFSAINNFATLRAKGEYLVLLNNDTEVIEPDWLQNMMEHAERPEVGAVGARLLYPNGLLQHAGVIVGIGGAANHAFSKKAPDDLGYMGQIFCTRDYSAVTGACMMLRKSVYEEMDGLDEENLAVAFNDVDFCLRLREKNYLVVYTPFASLYHHESLSRGYQVNFNEEYYLRRRHEAFFRQGDPYYNPNLTQERLDFSLKVSDNVKEK